MNNAICDFNRTVRSNDYVITNCANKYAGLVIQGNALLAHSGLCGNIVGARGDESRVGSMHAKMSAWCGKQNSMTVSNNVVLYSSSFSGAP